VRKRSYAGPQICSDLGTLRRRRACRKACSEAPTMRSGRQGAMMSAVAGSSITNVAATVSFSSVPARPAALGLRVPH